MTATKGTSSPEPGLVERPVLAGDEEALFREARRRQRRRWAIRSLIAALLLGATAVAVGLISSSRRQTPNSAISQPGRANRAVSSSVTLKLAGALAVAPDGSLYVADVGADRVLVRLADGRFRVVAGDGRVGFSGDGGPAVKAELSDVSDLAVAPNGDLYIADGGRIRAITPHGVIHTIAGDGRGSAQPMVISGTPARAAELGSDRMILHYHSASLSIAFSPHGQLYIATGSQILRLTAKHTLDVVQNTIASGLLRGQPLNSLGPIAIDRQGDIDVGGSTQGWSIWQVRPDGVAHEVGFARGSGGTSAVIQRAPDGAVYGENGSAIVRIEPRGLVTAYPFDQRVHGEHFTTTYFAFAPDGSVYADDERPDEGANLHQQLVKVGDGHVTLLWQEKNKLAGQTG